MAARSLEIGPAGIRAARTIEILRTERGLAQRELAARVTALGRPMTNTMLSRIERAQRRCDIDDLVALAQALRVPPLTLLHGIRAA
ncbi:MULTISPECIES: helix-turn-helix transcriptional regulator [unclassified Streptomyces]|uniref:helix-turn-helix domain-containing protein n=1 Tax=unclassified Streptomyces TaxID=2593676 RepID=UPI0023670DE8|nr:MULTISPECIES: helix-turn-helix transcriptional regulator [unclassified Streptomyces]MDF3144849.1 helix-turn-helix transcriptional regulator [Streptomyces sp. T21Q-yed]WDF39995.1 helix-turn-helix transcriptional regulator [Streptomyces sp. T12]